MYGLGMLVFLCSHGVIKSLGVESGNEAIFMGELGSQYTVMAYVYCTFSENAIGRGLIV